MKLSTIISTILLTLILFGCKKNNPGGSSSSGDFLQVTINGKTYSNNSTGVFSFTNQTGCVQKQFTLGNISQIIASDVFFDIYLNYYQNNVDFKNSTLGSYSVYEQDTFNPANACNLDLEVACNNNLGSNPPNYTLKTGGNHVVTNISQKNQTSTGVYYTVVGTFSCSFLTNLNQLIPATGKYQVTIEALK